MIGGGLGLPVEREEEACASAIVVVRGRAAAMSMEIGAVASPASVGLPASVLMSSGRGGGCFPSLLCPHC